MKISNGKIIIFIGIIHTLFSLSPDGFLNQWEEFFSDFFINVSPHLLQPLTILDYKKEAAFWFISWGILLIFFGTALDIIEKNIGKIPYKLRLSWLGFAMISTVMLPVSGFPVLVLPHAFYMVFKRSGKL